MELRQELYKHALVVANNGSHVEKSGAMYRLGMFFLTAFGTEKSVRNAFTWFCRAAEHDSIDAMGMIFRVEKATQETSTPLKANISTNTRARWIMSHLLSSLNSHYDPRLAPPSLDLNAIHSRIRQVLESIDPDILVHALKEDVEINIIRPKVDVNYYELITSKSSQRAQQLAANSPRLREILNAVSQHDVEALDDLLQRTTQLPPDFFNCLVTLAADRRSGNVLRSLVLKHGADPDWVDTHGGRHNTSLVDAVLRDDYEMAATLIDCGADATMLHAVTDLLVTECSTSIMRLALSTWLSIKIVTDNEDVYSGSSICHQFLDGVTPLMAEKYIQTGVPPDSSCMTPLFFAVVTNSLEKLQALLVSGANPNVRFQGMTPLHLAVSLLRPTSVLLLLAFGADPNSRNSRKAYITPLHTLSECFMIPIYDSSQDGSSKSGSYRQDVRWKGRSLEDLIQRRALIINILLKYGADPAVWCIDGFTPLMTAMANPHSKSDAVCTLLIQAGVSLDDLTPRGENIIHLAARMRDVYWLQRMLSASGSRLVNVRDNTLSTPLFLAARGKDAPEALDVLIAHGADIGIRGMYNLSCLDVAVLEGCQKNLITLLDHVANISVSKRRRLFEENDIQGRTPLHICLGSPDLDLACTYIRRILKIEKHVLYHLVTRRDYFGATPIDYAHFTGNYHALQLIAQFFLPIHLPVHISNSPTWQHCERFPNTGPILSSLTSYLAVESIVNDTRLTDISKCYDDCESSPTTKTMSAVENGLQRYLEEWRQSDGNQSERVILCMNYLATVSERYGRLRRSQDLYHKGWRLARSVFGEDSVVTQDFACKFLRVIEDRGLDTRICEEIAKWNSSRGRNNLTRSRLTQINTGGTANENSVAYESDRMGGLRPRECDRWKCSKTASFFCKGKFGLYDFMDLLYSLTR
jgi:ankyrin repeat protein